MQSLASLISMNGPDPTPDLDDDDQNSQPFKYSDQTQNEISEMIEQFNNQFLNNDNDSVGNNVGDQLEQHQSNSNADKHEIMQNGTVLYTFLTRLIFISLRVFYESYNGLNKNTEIVSK